MPLHIFLSTWIGSTLDLLPITKVLKDIVLIIGFSLALIASVKQAWFKNIYKDKLVWLMLAYGLLTIGLALLRPTDSDAEILGVVYNLRFLVFMVYGLLLSRLFKPQELRRKATATVVGVGVLVLLFGIVQYLALPNDALRHVGYERSNGVLPAFFIDDKPDLERAMSTLRDPNSLGSYVLIIGAIAGAFALRRRIPRQLAAGLLMLSGLCLVFTFSRSAWLGLVVMAAVLLARGYQFERLGRYQSKLVIAGMAALLIGGSLYPLRNTYFAQNVIFHADASTTAEDPNQLRGRFWQESISDIKTEPLGRGPGTAGLASIRNNQQGVTLNENYYLQIASEVGLIGLGLFLAILIVVGLRLYRVSGADSLALALFASFCGLLATNFLVHIWSNEAVAYTWWGLAGLCLAGRANGLPKSDKVKH